MSGFSAEWLALREAADAAARAPGVTRLVTDALSSHVQIAVLDLGTGTGSNVRYLAPRLTQARRWRLVDDDRVLLQQARASAPGAETVQGDLGRLDPAWFDGFDLVTASALLDLVSAAWLELLVDRCRRVGACVLAVLNYDGRISCDPADADDALIVELVNHHQHRDKGLGPALGPEAGRTAERMLAAAGYRVRREPSDWTLGADQRELQRQLIAGWAAAAREMRPGEQVRIDAWARRRLVHVDAARSRLSVGHDDVAGVP